MAKSAMAKEEDRKGKILAAIRRAAAELGRSPSRGELRRITGVSHYRVLAEFRTLREAVRAAGLEPNPKGEKISTEDLLSDWKRVAEKLGRRPSRAEYVREGRYSAGALTVRFGSWGKIHHGGTHPAKPTPGSSGAPGTETRRKAKKIGRELTRKTRINQKPDRFNHKGHEETQRGERSGDLVIGTSGDHPITRNACVLGTPGDRKTKSAPAVTKAKEWNRQNTGHLGRDEYVLRGFDRVPLAPVPTPLVGMRKVTEAVAQMVVNTLMGSGYWPLAIGSWPDGSRELTRRSRICEEQVAPEITARGLYKDRAVMGEPFDRRPMTNAPVNELGVMVLFGMVAAGLGLQVESVQGKFPDCTAKRQVAPGKWQHLRIEFEYESKNFKLHGHDPKGCDMIVCWRHNWKECPEGIEVVELCRMFGME